MLNEIIKTGQINKTGTTNKLGKALRSKGGASIMEAIVSLLILGILMTTIVSIVSFSTALTARSLDRAASDQAIFNNLMLGNYTTATTPELRIILIGAPVGSLQPALNARHSISLSADMADVVAFMPVED